MDGIKPIFDFERTDWKYKGILEGWIDNAAMRKKDPNCPFPPEMDDFNVEFWAIIYEDETGDWILKGRVKYPSGNKNVLQKNFGKNQNCTKILQEIYNLFPLRVGKNWFRCKCETGEGMLRLLQENDMILSVTVQNIG